MSAPIGEEFLRKTRYPFLPPSDQSRGVPPPPLEVEPLPDAPRLDLPAPAKLSIPPADLSRAITQRASVRRYRPTALTAEELSYLLWCTQGVKQVQQGFVTMRTVPSAGARHALETCLLINRVAGLDAGLYRFLASRHELQQFRAGSGLAEQMTRACFDQRMVADSAATFVWTAVPYRMTWRYSQRGYRYLYLDAGHVCQNLYLAAEAIDCGVCAIGAFDDEAMDALLGLDGREQFTLYLATVGKKP
jgi:SagB-type dehydrogenase family enzyme